MQRSDAAPAEGPAELVCWHCEQPIAAAVVELYGGLHPLCADEVERALAAGSDVPAPADAPASSRQGAPESPAAPSGAPSTAAAENGRESGAQRPATGAGSAAVAATPAAEPATTWPRFTPWGVLAPVGVYGPGLRAELNAAGVAAAVRDVGAAAALGAQLGVRRLYLPRAVRELAGLPATLPPELGPRDGQPHLWVEAAGGTWDIQPAGLAPWIDVWDTTTRGKGCAVVIPEWDRELGARFGALAPAELAAALGQVAELAGVDYHRSPGRTMIRMLDEMVRRGRADRPEPVTMPDPIAKGKVRLPTFHAPLQSPEAGAALLGMPLAALDITRQFLSATRGTEFGIGQAEHRQRPAFEPLPGTWRVRTTREALQLAPELPALAPTSGNRSAVDLWLPTELLTLMAERDRRAGSESFTISEAWVWPQHRRGFDAAGDRLTRGLQQLDAGQPAGAAVEAVLKAMYRQFLGGWLGSDFGGARSEDDPWSRRDWWLTIRAQSGARLQRHVLRALNGDPRQPERPTAGQLGAVILGVETDCVYVAAPDLDRLGEIFPIDPPENARNGKFKLKESGIVTAELVETLTDKRHRHDNSAGRITALQNATAGSEVQR